MVSHVRLDTFGSAEVVTLFYTHESLLGYSVRTKGLTFATMNNSNIILVYYKMQHLYSLICTCASENLLLYIGSIHETEIPAQI